MTSRFVFLKGLFVIPAVFLNLFFLGTSHALSHLPYPYFLVYDFAISDIAGFFGLDLINFYDAASLILLALLVTFVYIGYRSEGIRQTILRTFLIGSATLLPLGLEIYTLDRPEWNIGVASFQVYYNVAPWFTNADLFFSCLVILTGTSFIWYYLARQGNLEKRKSTAVKPVSVAGGDTEPRSLSPISSRGAPRKDLLTGQRGRTGHPGDESAG